MQEKLENFIVEKYFSYKTIAIVRNCNETLRNVNTSSAEMGTAHTFEQKCPRQQHFEFWFWGNYSRMDNQLSEYRKTWYSKWNSTPFLQMQKLVVLYWVGEL